MTPTIAAIRERLEKATAMVRALCKPKASKGAREWIMSIPARPDHDPDLVIAAALGDITALLAENERLRNALKLAVEELEFDHKHSIVERSHERRLVTHALAVARSALEEK